VGGHGQWGWRLSPFRQPTRPLPFPFPPVAGPRLSWHCRAPPTAGALPMTVIFAPCKPQEECHGIDMKAAGCGLTLPSQPVTFLPCMGRAGAAGTLISFILSRHAISELHRRRRGGGWAAEEPADQAASLAAGIANLSPHRRITRVRSASKPVTVTLPAIASWAIRFRPFIFSDASAERTQRRSNSSGPLAQL